MGCLINFGIKPLIVLLNINIAGLGSPGPMGADLMYIMIKVKIFLHGVFAIFMHASVCTLLWWLYDNDSV